ASLERTRWCGPPGPAARRRATRRSFWVLAGRRRTRAARHGRTRTESPLPCLETRLGEWPSVDGQDTSRKIEARRLPGVQQLRGARCELARQERQGEGGVGVDGDAFRIARELAPALGLFEAGTRGAAEMRDVGHDLKGVAVAADAVVEELRLHARLIDEVLRRAAAEHHGCRARMPDHDVRRLDDVADDVDVTGRRIAMPRL